MTLSEFLYKEYGGLLSLKQAEKVLCRSKNTILEEIERGNLQVTMMGTRYKFLPEWLEEYVDRYKVQIES